MTKKPHIKIPLPKWTWKQITITIVVIILACRIDVTPALELLKAVLKSWVAR